MSVSKEGKEYCMNNLVSMVVNRLAGEFKQYSAEEIFNEFSKSETYELLFDSDTRLWAEGPDYILCMYSREKGVKFDFLGDYSMEPYYPQS